MRPTIIAALALIAPLMPAIARADITTYEGLYVPNYPGFEGWTCTNIGQDGGAVGFQDGQMIGLENSCTMANERALPELGAHLYDMTCSGEGETSTQSVMLMQHDAGIYVIYPGVVVDWAACD